MKRHALILIMLIILQVGSYVIFLGNYITHAMYAMAAVGGAALLVLLSRFLDWKEKKLKNIS